MNAPAFISTRPATTFSVEIFDAADAVKYEWLGLEAAGGGSLFQRYDLMTLWYRALRPEDGRPVIALVRRADNRRAVALFPMVSRRRGLITWLELADGGVLDYCQPLLHPAEIGAENIADLMRAVQKALPGDVLYINKIPAVLHQRPNPMVELKQRARLMLSAWYVPLADNAYEDVVLPRQSSQHKSRLRRKTRKLDREHGRRPSLSVGPDVTEADYQLLREMRVNNFASEDRRDGLTNPQWEEFYRALIRGEGGAVQAWISRIDSEDQTIAVLFGLVDDRGAVALMPASKRDQWAKFAPGTQLFDASMELFTARGAAGLDLSIGDNPFKLYIGADKIALYDFMFAGTPLGALVYGLWRIKVALRNSPFVRKLLRRDEVVVAEKPEADHDK